MLFGLLVKLGNELPFPWKLLIQQEKDDLIKIKNIRKNIKKTRRNLRIRSAERETTTLQESFASQEREGTEEMRVKNDVTERETPTLQEFFASQKREGTEEVGVENDVTEGWEAELVFPREGADNIQCTMA